MRLKFFGSSIRIHWMFWLLCAFLGMDFLKEGSQVGVVKFFILTGLVLFSILGHELAHASMRRRYGAAYSEITLWGMGGLCSGPGNFSPGQSIMISLAGPVFNLLVGVILLALNFTPLVQNLYLQILIELGAWINLGWGIMNLLPILPLDGGRIFSTLLADKAAIVPWIGLILATMLAIWGFLAWKRFIFAGVIFTLIALENLKILSGRSIVPR